MKKVILCSGILYFALGVVTLIFLFNNFTQSLETNFVFRIISVILLCYISTFPLLVATSKNIQPPIWFKIILYTCYCVFEFFALLLAHKTFGDNSFMFNSQISAESFRNSQVNLTSSLWILALFTGIGHIVILSIKMGKEWNDWTFFLLIPFAPVVIGLFIGFLFIMFTIFIFKLIFHIGGALADGVSTGYSSNSSYDGDSSDDNSSEEDQRRSSGILRSPGENYYDYQGVLRSPGENYYDGNGGFKKSRRKLLRWKWGFKKSRRKLLRWE